MNTINAISITGLTQYIKTLLEDDEQLQQVWVVGEVTSLKRHPSGLFFALTDIDGTSSLRCVVWRNVQRKLVKMPEKGEQVLVLGSVRLYPKRGEYQLQGYQVLPAGEGLKELRYQQLRSRLQAEGLFDTARKRPLPPHPQVIAVISSPTAAAWGDIQRTISRRYPGLHLLFSPAIVQGAQAPASIAQAFGRIERDNRAELTILARGGGAVEDLDCFNEELVVRAIAECQRPVITGIGHQRDETLADLVADICAHTPTAAAEMAVPDILQRYRDHTQRKNALVGVLQQRLTTEKEQLAAYQRRLSSLPQQARVIQHARYQCQLFQEKLAALDPNAVLKRGYAVVQQQDGTIVRDGNAIAPGTELTIQLGSGQLTVQVLNAKQSS
ncbi:exodeoxyribonuclease VII large subunit [Spirulina sp. CS-785/01]|uniref:exodeoxyribonuclease VII large subunit n=1 Tax=Spirulina sp. CS-785/01 TaxID=3021716 RepID=UPI00232F437A|nr:exodeoxyribonuclease VII large subunit [Spirulina sp. CS-785/01]MDB9314676.1 exodeoxyribonuclease VII large subunit [Spirulina sp. CS-785/01]